MKLKPHPRYAEFEAWFAARLIDTQATKADFFRVAGPKHTTAKEIVSGIGAWIAGGRWNAPESMKVVYLSTEPETAVAVANEHYRYHRLPVSAGMPKVLVAVRVECTRVLNLRDARLVADFPESIATLLAEDWRAVMSRGDEATTQAIGRAAFAAGIKGFLVPSKPVPAGVNLCVFPDRIGKGDHLSVLNPDALEKLSK